MTTLSIRIFTALTIIFAGTINTAVAHTSGGLVVKNAWVREAPPTAKVMAAYMKIENHTDKDKTLVSVSSSTFDRIEIHDTVEKNGMTSMIQQHKVLIKAQGEVIMQPNGMHIMLFTPKNPLKAGDEVTFTLKFANGSTAMTSAKVKKAKGGSHQHEHHGHHESLDKQKHGSHDSHSDSHHGQQQEQKQAPMDHNHHHQH